MLLLKVQTRRKQLRIVCAALSLSAALLFPAFGYGATVSGVVLNKTTNRPDAGDEVVLIGLMQSMQELARTRTDAHGHYVLDIPDTGMHLIRVDHEKANYFAAVTPGATQVNVDVYDVGAKVDGVTTEADTLRIETDAQGLHVTESYFVTNASRPPRTQFGPRSYEFYLPADAQLGSAIAMGPGGMPVASSPIPVGGKGHYAFIFPIRPGETRFQVNYHPPYSGSISFRPRVWLATAAFGVILPKSMQFQDDTTPFSSVNGDANAQTFVVRNVRPSQTPAFSISGNGVLQDASDGQDNAGQAGSSTPSAASTDTRPGIGLGAPIDTPDPLSKYKWWILSGVGLILVVGAALFLRSGGSTTSESEGPQLPQLSQAPAVPSASLWLAGLKEQLFAVETEWLQKKISEAEYREQRMALDVLLKRALSRESAPLSQNSPPKSGSVAHDAISLTPQADDV